MHTVESVAKAILADLDNRSLLSGIDDVVLAEEIEGNVANLLEQAASIAFHGVEEEGYPGSIDRRPVTLRNAIMALWLRSRP
jgi:hypothetical protein